MPAPADDQSRGQPPEAADKADDAPHAAGQASEKAGLKLLIELTPLVVWLVVFKLVGLIPATGVLVVATLLSVIAAHFLLGKVSPMLMVTAALVTVFGGLTVAFDEPRFIKIKPTVVNLLFAAALGFGLATGRNFLKMMLGEAIQLTATGWRLLTLRWIGLFTVMAVLNEIIWRATNTPQQEYLWGYFKFPGLVVMPMIFMALHLPFLRKHAETPAQT